MKDLEQYIKKNREILSSGNLPLGHKERFMAKLQVISNNNLEETATKSKTIKSKYRNITTIVLSVAAMFIITFIIGNFSKKESGGNISIITPNIYAIEMENEEKEVLELVKNLDPNTEEQVINILENITFEAIPISEQLPSELSNEQKAKILKEYYNQKTAGIKKIKMFLAQETVQTEE